MELSRVAWYSTSSGSFFLLARGMSIDDVASVGSGATDVRRSHTGARARVKRLNGE